MEVERGERDALSRRGPGIVKEPTQGGARSAESTRRPGCGGRLNRVTRFVVPGVLFEYPDVGLDVSIDLLELAVTIDQQRAEKIA